jgi:teichuronic acid biosynthesis glycosyltransferase TuaH
MSAQPLAAQPPWGAIVVAAVPYDGSMPLGCWQLARVLGRRRPVLYVEPPHSVARGVRFGPFLRPADDGSAVHVLTPAAPPAYDRTMASDLADIVISRQVARAAARCLEGPHVMFACTPRRGLLRIPYDVLVYWQRDAVEMLARRGRAEWLERRHARLLKAADVVTGVSPDLIARSAADGRDATLVPNGCDYDHFVAPRPRPAELPADRVVVGFSGGVSDRIDADLLLSLADARPDWLFVTVGEVARPLPRRENLLVVGRRSYAELPAWLQAFDVGIVPYLEDARNLHSHPLKAFEYLAAGRPVVSVPIAALRGFDPVVRLGSGTPAFLAALDQAIGDPPSPDECRSVARGQSWLARVDQLEELVEQQLGAAADGRRPAS